jgi:hypothetical protein
LARSLFLLPLGQIASRVYPNRKGFLLKTMEEQRTGRQAYMRLQYQLSAQPSFNLAITQSEYNLLGAIQIEEEEEPELEESSPVMVKDSTLLMYLMEEGLGVLRSRAVQSMQTEVQRVELVDDNEGGVLARQLSCLLDLPRTMTVAEMTAFSDSMLELDGDEDAPRKQASLDSVLGNDINEFVDDDGEDDDDDDDGGADQSEDGGEEQQRRLKMKKTEIELMSLWERRRRDRADAMELSIAEDTAAKSALESGGGKSGISDNKSTGLAVVSTDYGATNLIERKLYEEQHRLKPQSFYGLGSDPNASFRIAQMESEKEAGEAQEEVEAEKAVLYDQWAGAPTRCSPFISLSSPPPPFRSLRPLFRILTALALQQRPNWITLSGYSGGSRRRRGRRRGRRRSVRPRGRQFLCG